MLSSVFDPERRIARPEALHFVVRLPIGERRVDGLRETVRQAIGEIRRGAGRSFRGAIVDHGEQLVERIGEKLHGVVGELVGDCLHRNSGAREIVHGLLRDVDGLFEAGARMAVIAKRVERGGRNRIDRVGADEFLDVHDVAIGRIFRAGAGPQQALRLRAACGECLASADR